MGERIEAHGPLLPKRGADFEAFYRVAPPWEIGRPQNAILDLADRGGLRGRVLDVGCGSGEHALMAASRGFDATGIDAAPTPIGLARAKARERRLRARFVVGDALELPSLFAAPFDTVIDSALFHVFDDDDRPRYADALAAVTVRGARCMILCFSEHAPGTGGPRRVTEAEIRSCFTSGWQVDAVDPARLETVGMDVPAWLAVMTRT